MIHKFSKEVAIAELQGPVGVEFDLQSPIEDARALGGLASSANAFVAHAVKCFVLGFDAEGAKLALKAVEWLNLSLREREVPSNYVANATEAMRIRDLCLANWLVGIDAGASLADAVKHWEQYFQTEAGRDSSEVASVLVDYLDCGHVEAIRSHVSQLWPHGRRPLEVRTVVALCEKRATRQLVPSDVGALLTERIDGWFYSGHYNQFARWVKVGSIFSSREPAAKLLRQAYEVSGG